MLYLFIGASLIIAGKAQIECTSDSDCSAIALSPKCAVDAATPYCVPCLEDSDCSGNAAYSASGATSCTVTLGYGACGASAGCSSDSDCSVPGLLKCSTSISTCVQCLEDADCEADSTYSALSNPTCTVTVGVGICSAGSTVSGCSSDSDCTTEGLEACFTTTGTCVACNDDDDCTGSSYYTNLGYTSCVGVACIAGTSSGCSSDDDCTSSLLPTCSNGACIAEITDFCTEDSECTTTYGEGATCVDADINYCLPDGTASCTSDDGCIGGTCEDYTYYMACDYDVCSSDDDCTGDLSCTGDSTTAGICYQSCSSDSDCGVTGYSCTTEGDVSGCVYSGSNDDGVNQATIFIGMIIMTAAGLFM